MHVLFFCLNFNDIDLCILHVEVKRSEWEKCSQSGSIGFQGWAKVQSYAWLPAAMATILTCLYLFDLYGTPCRVDSASHGALLRVAGCAGARCSTVQLCCYRSSIA